MTRAGMFGVDGDALVITYPTVERSVMGIWRHSGLRDRAASFAIAVFLLGAIGEPVLLAQTGIDDGEVSVMGGGSFGMGSRPYVQGGVGYTFSKHGMALVESSYTPLGTNIIWRRANVQSPQNSYLLDFAANFHIQFPVGEHWAPYGLVGAGLLFNSFRAVTTSEGALVGIQDFKGVFYTGGGVRYHVTPHWGVRSECKFGVSSRTFTRVSIGVFYNLPSDWP
jgi:hypothetical protein